MTPAHLSFAFVTIGWLAFIGAAVVTAVAFYKPKDGTP